MIERGGVVHFFRKRITEEQMSQGFDLSHLLCWLASTSFASSEGKYVVIIIIINKADLEQTVYPLLNCAKQSTI